MKIQFAHKRPGKYYKNTGKHENAKFECSKILHSKVAKLRCSESNTFYILNN